MTEETARAYHYTRGNNFLRIIDDGVILRCGDRDESHLPQAARTPIRERAVWFSLSEEFDPTSLPLRARADGTIERAVSLEELCQREGAYRIAVAASVVPDGFDAWARRSKAPKATVRSLLAAARSGAFGIGGPPAPVHLWRVSYEPVPARLWLAAEEWSGGAWRPVDWQSWRASA